MPQHDRGNDVHRDSDLATVITLESAIGEYPAGTDLETFLRQLSLAMARLEGGGTQSFIATANLRRIQTGQLAARAIHWRSFSVTGPTANAYMVILGTGSLAGRAIILKTASSSVVGDAYFITPTVSGSLSANAVLYALAISSISANAELVHTGTGSIAALAILMPRLTADAYIASAGGLDAFQSDAFQNDTFD